MHEIIPGLWLSGQPHSYAPFSYALVVCGSAGDVQPDKSLLNPGRLELVDGGGIEESIDLNGPALPATLISKTENTKKMTIVRRIPVTDEETTDLLAYFEAAVEWMDQVLSFPSSTTHQLLVHCVSGISRSPTIILAYLMRRKGMGLDDALAVLFSIKSDVCPNDGFRAQLQLWHEMKYVLEPRYPGYLAFKHAKASSYAPDGRMNVSSSKSHDEIDVRCRKCRTRLPFQQVKHLPGTGQNSFSYQKRDSALKLKRDGGDPVDPCTSLFSEPLDWMMQGCGDDATADFDGGKITCPKLGCEAKLGQWSWAGHQCSCGAWMCPAFVLAKGKVDTVVHRK